MLIKDEWLSQYFPNGAYRYTEPFVEDKIPSGFMYAKVPVQNNELLNKLLSQEFELVEVAINFTQKTTMKVADDKHLTTQNMVIDSVSMADKTQVIELAKHAFNSSRFHQDGKIDKQVASKIKADWVANYFQGNRGNGMLVARCYDTVCGFILLIDSIIDLIAVSSSHLRQGIASQLIASANRERGPLCAGTQLINQASIATYQKAGFQLEKAHFVLHKHVSPRL